jgi:hypothetical protein
MCFIGLDVTLESTAICIVDETGRIMREGKATSDPEAIAGWVAQQPVSIVRRAGGRPAGAMALRRARRQVPAGALPRDQAGARLRERLADQDRPVRRPAHRRRCASVCSGPCTSSRRGARRSAWS